MNNSTTFQLKARAVLCTSLAVLLAACGGGSGADTPQTMPSEFLKSANANPGSNGYESPTTTTTATTTATTATTTPTTTTTTTTTTPTPTTTTATTTTTSTYNFYVATTGSDSNPGTQAAPFKTILKASQVAKPDTTIHVAAGTYSGGFQTTVSGTASGRIRYVSDTKWGAKIVPAANSTSATAWNNRGDYIDIDGFEIDGTNTQSGTAWLNGIYTGGSYTAIKNNHVHHIGTTGACTSNGGSAIGTDHYYYGVNDDVIGNVVHHTGFTGCSYIQGIYISTSGNVKNNLVYQIGAVAIHLWHDATSVTIANNTVFGSRFGILVGGGDFYHSTAGNNNTHVVNNIVFDNLMGIGEQGTTGPDNTYTNNLVYQNTNYNWSLQNGKTHTGDITADPQFVNYIRTGGGDYHLKTSSPAIDKGVPTYAPSVDLDGTVRFQGAGYDIGTYEFH